MLLRRVIEHVKAQNWTAVALDFVIVVVGVFIGIQVSNWNDARADKAQEAAILAQLEDEFSEIKVALGKQIRLREGYSANLKSLIAGLEGSDSRPDDETIKRGLIGARATGRRPAQSSAYIQLTTNGDLARLSNENLKNALIRYHARLERDAFIFPELMRMVVQEMSSNEFVDFDPDSLLIGAAVDLETEKSEANAYKSIRSYDYDGLHKYEQRYEALYLMHANLVNADKTQLELVNEILNEISEGRE